MASTRQGAAHLDEVYALLPFEPVAGHGVWLEAADGRQVLDFYGGHAVALLGYAHPALTAALSSQIEKLQFQSNAAPLKLRDEAAGKLAAFAPDGLDRVFFVNSGAEANENALRLALKLTGRRSVVAIEHGFHGRTAGAAAVTWGARESWYGFPQTPMDVQFVPRDDAAALHSAIDSSTAAVIMEPVQGLAGAFDLDPQFLHAARQACDRSGALLILDEVQCGMGRLGAPFGASLHQVRPDLLTTAKGLAGGYPCSALLMSQALAADLKTGDLGTTFGGNPVACAGISAVIDAIEQEHLLERVNQLSATIRQSCITGPVTGIRGLGFLLGLETTVPAATVRNALLKRNILTGTSTDKHVLRLLPPLILERGHVEQLAAALQELPSEIL